MFLSFICNSQHTEKFLPGSKGDIGRPSADNRLFISVGFWI